MDVAGRSASSRYLAKQGVGRIGIRVVEPVTVQHVERFGTNLELEPFVNKKMLDRTLTTPSDAQDKRVEPETERSLAERSAGGGVARGAAAARNSYFPISTPTHVPDVRTMRPVMHNTMSI